MQNQGVEEFRAPGRTRHRVDTGEERVAANSQGTLMVGPQFEIVELRNQLTMAERQRDVSLTAMYSAIGNANESKLKVMELIQAEEARREALVVSTLQNHEVAGLAFPQTPRQRSTPAPLPLASLPP